MEKILNLISKSRALDWTCSITFLFVHIRCTIDKSCIGAVYARVYLDNVHIYITLVLFFFLLLVALLPTWLDEILCYCEGHINPPNDLICSKSVIVQMLLTHNFSESLIKSTKVLVCVFFIGSKVLVLYLYNTLSPAENFL